MSADRLERIVWEWAKGQLAHPDDIIDRLREELAAQTAVPDTAQVERIGRQIIAKAAEKARVLTMFRKALVSQDEAEREIAAITSEQAELERIQRDLTATSDKQQAYSDMILSTESLLTRLASQIAAAENDDNLKRIVIEGVVDKVVIHPGRAQDGDDIEIVARM